MADARARRCRNDQGRDLSSHGRPENWNHAEPRGRDQRTIDLPGPLSQVCLGRDGTFFVMAAGRANHAGAGNWQGVTTGNSRFIGIEAENTGETTGPNADPWPAVQLDAYRRGVAAILKKIKANAIMCCGHKEYALPMGRKSDPTFDMDDLRMQVAFIMAGTWLEPRRSLP